MKLTVGGRSETGRSSYQEAEESTPCFAYIIATEAHQTEGIVWFRIYRVHGCSSVSPFIQRRLFNKRHGATNDGKPNEREKSRTCSVQEIDRTH